jgi:hypothetical protein
LDGNIFGNFITDVDTGQFDLELDEFSE